MHTIMKVTLRGVACCAIATLSIVGVGSAHAAPARSARNAPNVQLGQYLGGAFGARIVQQFVSDLARVGVPVFAPGATSPVDPVIGRASPLQLTLDQAQSAALGIANHAGWTGARLDGLAHVGRGQLVVPLGAIVAGWAKQTRTPAAALARRILGRPDWRRYRQTVFPVAVLLLFAADVGSHLPTRPPGRAADVRQAADAAATGPCTAVAGFIRNAIDWFFKSIGRVRTDPKTIHKLFGNGFLGRIIIGVGDVLSRVVNATVDAIHEVVIDGVKVAIGTVTNAVAAIAGAAAVAGSVISALQPWTGTMSAAPNPTSKGIGTGIPGTLTLNVTAPGSALQWPPWIVNCASPDAFNIPLPMLTPTNARVTWDLVQQYPAGLVVPQSGTSSLDAQGNAQLQFSTTAESPELARGDLAIGQVRAIARVHRTDVDQLEETLTRSLVARVPSVVQSFVAPALRAIVQPVLDQLTAKINQLRDLDVAQLIAVRYHTPAPAPPRRKRKGKHGPGGTRGTELHYGLPDACSLLTLSDVAAVMVPGPIDGPTLEPGLQTPAYADSRCDWRALGDFTGLPPAAISVVDSADSYPSAKAAHQAFVPRAVPSTAIRITGFGDEAYYIPGYAVNELVARVANLELIASTSTGTEADDESLMRDMLSHLPRPTRVPAIP